MAGRARISRRARVALVAACGALLAGAGAGAGAPSAGAGSAKAVTVGSNYFSPAKVKVRVGDRVRWEWEGVGFDLHDVVVDRGPQRFRSPLQAGGSYSHRFKKPGTYKLYCSEHDMTMTVVVRRTR